MFIRFFPFLCLYEHFVNYVFLQKLLYFFCHSALLTKDRERYKNWFLCTISLPVGPLNMDLLPFSCLLTHEMEKHFVKQCAAALDNLVNLFC